MQVHNMHTDMHTNAPEANPVAEVSVIPENARGADRNMETDLQLVFECVGSVNSQ